MDSPLKIFVDDADFNTARANLKKDPNSKAILVFSAHWCGPCNRIKPHYIALAEKYPDIKFWYVDGDECEYAMKRFGITSFPTFVALVAGKGTTIEPIEGANAEKITSMVEELHAL